jgi:AcrR family transcriptional regulator
MPIASTPARERILKAAIALIAKRGYHATTVGDIEAAAGLTRRAGGFYRHFTSKEDGLVQGVRRMADEMVADIQLKDVVSLKAIRAELLLIARALIRHADAHRPLRLVLQREGSHLPTLRAEARRANAKLATLDVVPWIRHALRRTGTKSQNPEELGLLIFGPVLVHIISIDRGDPAFGLNNAKFLTGWADHWSGWFARSGRD